MGRLAAIAIAGCCLTASLAGCGGSSASAADCSSFHSLIRQKNRIGAADSQVIRVEKTIHTLPGLQKVERVEKNSALPIYRSVLREATQQQGSATDSVLRSGWSEIASAARLRVRGATAIERSFHGGKFSPAGVAALRRISQQVIAADKLWNARANRLDNHFGSCT